jgi:uracil-DNA glycosylase
MKPARFVTELSALEFDNAFNPYSDRCTAFDCDDAPAQRAQVLTDILDAAISVEVDAIWVGRDLGYRGGRRTGLALTDDVHVEAHVERWGVSAPRATRGHAVAERTAAVIWDVLSQIEEAIFLWNVFPLHPHEPGDPFSNRSHNAKERRAGEEILRELILLLRPKRLVAIGNNAAASLRRHEDICAVMQVRHPSYGGQNEFLSKVRNMYGVQHQRFQQELF